MFLGIQNMKFEASRLVALLAVVLLPATAWGQQSPTAPRSLPISGYMDFHFNKVRHEDATIDFHRFVLLFNHAFTPKIRFVGELELEHAFVEGLEEAGELELEQAYLDFLIRRSFNIRAGMVLVPVGIINERHEPPVFNGVERPLLDTAIIPSTWFEPGVGVHGEIGQGWRYRAYLLAPLNALEFSAEEGIRGGRQKGSQARMRNAAGAARVEYLGLPDFSFGASLWVGKGNTLDTPLLDTPVYLKEVDARYAGDRLELRAQFADLTIDRADLVNDAVTSIIGVDPNVARGLRGFYTEAAYRIWAAGSPRDLVGFVRYERVHTQHRMPAGWLPLEEFNRSSLVVGLTYFPDPDVAVKGDYVHQTNRSGFISSPSSFNVGLGWWF
jgi:hypothetical protein